MSLWHQLTQVHVKHNGKILLILYNCFYATIDLLDT